LCCGDAKTLVYGSSVIRLLNSLRRGGGGGVFFCVCVVFFWEGKEGISNSATCDDFEFRISHLNIYRTLNNIYIKKGYNSSKYRLL